MNSKQAQKFSFHHLVYQEGYSSGESGAKVTYEYDNTGKLVKEEIERPSGKVTKEY